MLLPHLLFSLLFLIIFVYGQDGNIEIVLAGTLPLSGTALEGKGLRAK